MFWQIFRLRVNFPKRLKGINDPVVLMKEECVDGCEGRLDNSSYIPTGEVVWGGIGVGIFFCWHWSCKATLTPGWKGFVVTNAELGFQQCPWKGFGSAPASRCFHFHDRSKPNGSFFVRAIDVAAVDECCYPIDLLSWFTLAGTEYVGPRKGKTRF